MPQGISPTGQVNTSGGLRLPDGEEQDNNLILVALGDDDNENAFQQGIGLGDEVIFEINDDSARAQVIAKLIGIFDKFERLKRFKLRQNTIRFEKENGNMSLSFSYLNLETDEEQLFRRSQSNAGNR